jgi:hypothetical protein
MLTRLVMLGVLVPVLASAQPAPNDPNAPTPTEVSPPPPAPAPPAPDSPPPPDAPTTVQGPAVIVTPPVPVVNTGPEPEYRVVYDSYNAPVFATGALVFAISYGASVITASTNSDRGNNRLYVPVVGPWLALNDRGSCDITRAACDHETTAKVLLIADGVFQAAGIVGMLDGLLQPSSHREVLTTGKIDTRTRVRPTMIGSASGSGPGVAVLGHF